MLPQYGELHISVSRLWHNVNVFRSRLGAKVAMGATVKANAYGHGIGLVLPTLVQAGVQWAIVYSLEEVRELYQTAPGVKILVLSPLVLARDEKYRYPLEEDMLHLIASGQVRVNLTDLPSAQRLSSLLGMIGGGNIAANVHVQVDTGLTRIGVEPRDAVTFFTQLQQLPHLKLEGIFAHFSHGDEPQHPTVIAQSDGLLAIARVVRKTNPELMVHIQNSGGAWYAHPENCSMARLGIGLYGLQPSMQDPIPELLPVAKMVAPILAIQPRPTGIGVGYGHSFVTERPSKLAVVPVGYAEGYPRAMSNRGVVQVNGHEASVVGRVSMDQIIVDVTDIPAQMGDEVTVISNDPEARNSVDRIAEEIGTIGYEIATGFGPRLRKKLVD